MISVKLPKQLFVIASFLLVASKSSAITNSPAQYTIRGGSISGAFTGAASGSFEVLGSTDLEYETFSSNNQSWAARFSFAYQFDTGRVYYAYSGIGQRYYFGSATRPFSYMEEGILVKGSPRWKYYVGWDYGLSSVLVKAITSVLSISSTGMDGGLTAGVTYWVYKGIALNLSGTYGIYYGFTNVTASGNVMKLLAGVSF